MYRVMSSAASNEMMSCSQDSGLSIAGNWLGDGPTDISVDLMNQLVLDYLVTEGYKEAAEKLREEAGLPASSSQTVSEDEEKRLTRRIQIRQQLHQGDVQTAIEMINDLNPEILDTDPFLHFRLMQQKLIEMIRGGHVDEALAFAQQNLAEKGEADGKVLEQLEQTMALLAFEDPLLSPFAELLHPQHRQRVANEVNAAILAADSRRGCPKLETLLKMLEWGEENLHRRHVTFPRMVDIGEGRLEDMPQGRNKKFIHLPMPKPALLN